MATTTAPKKPAAPAAPAPVRRPQSTWKDRLTHSSFFLGAILFHLILFLMVATWIIFPAFVPPADDFKKTYVPSGGPPPPPPSSVQVKVPTPNVTIPTPVITSNNASQSFTIPLPDLATVQPTTQSTQAATLQKTDSAIHSSRSSALRSTLNGWGRDGSNISSSNGDPHNVVAKFPVYLASYANGDWGCNTFLSSNGQILAGSLFDLVEKVNQWSHGKIKGELVTTPLNIGGPELLAKMPPFIFFTGHKDFQLTDGEITNLQKYLNNGGAIWGDNALPGQGSRFDVAFRREMKRVLPDKDKNFEPLDLSHEIFAKSWFPISKMPQGMNFYTEPLLHIDIEGKLAILYTPNDYSDLFYCYIKPGDQEVEEHFFPGSPVPFKINKIMWDNRKIFFRNFELAPALAAQQFGMNVIGYLLVRFDKEALLAP